MTNGEGEKRVNSINDIMELHNNSGNIEDAYYHIYLEDKVLNLNTFTLFFTSNTVEKNEVQLWNDRIEEEIRKDRTLAKEIKEFRVLFEFLRQLKVKKGYLSKTESPDFVLTRDEKTYGIEVTQIYSGNDWAAEKIKEDIKNYGIDSKELPGYIEYRKYHNKITTYQLKENIVIKPLEEVEVPFLHAKIKNKIFEKIRKMFDEYHSYDENVLIVKIVSPEHFISMDEIEAFHQEIQFFISHLEVDVTKKEYVILIKLGKKIIKFDLTNNLISII